MRRGDVSQGDRNGIERSKNVRDRTSDSLTIRSSEADRTSRERWVHTVVEGTSP